MAWVFHTHINARHARRRNVESITRGASRALGHVLIDERENIHVNDGEGQDT